MSGSPTPGSPTKQKKTLDSEVSTEEAEALLTFVQTIARAEGCDGADGRAAAGAGDGADGAGLPASEAGGLDYV